MAQRRQTCPMPEMHANDASDLMSAERGESGPRDARLRLRWGAVAGGAALVAATFVAYIPALRAGYVWDDDRYLTGNTVLQRPGGLAAIWEIRYHSEAGRLRVNTPQYYPLVFTSFWIEQRLWGLEPAGYHAVNVALHALGALLVWRLARGLRLPAAWFVAAVFALHPVQVESVAWITERKNVLAGVFYLLALLASLSFLERARARWYVAGLLLFVAALFSKTVTCSLPVVILLIRWYQRRRIGLREGLLVVPMLVLGLAAGLFTAYLERTHVGAAHIEWEEGLFERAFIVAPRAFWFYAGKVVWPHPLVFVYPRWQIDATVWTSYLPLGGLLLAVGGALVGARRFGRGPLTLLACAGVTLFPALGFLDVYPHRFSWVADHFQYLGGLGFVILYTSVVAWPGARLTSGRQLAGLGRVAASCCLLVLAGLTYRQSQSYENEERLWADTLAANPDAWIASLNLGVLAARSGHYAQAAKHFEYTAGFPASRSVAYGDWGVALLRLQRVDGAITKFAEALRIDPDDARAHAGLGTAYLAAGRLDEAERALQTALQLDPEWLMARLNLSRVYLRQQRWDEAEDCLRYATQLLPYDDGVRVCYAELLSKTGRWDEAVENYRVVPAERLHARDAVSSFVEALCQSGNYAEALRVCQGGLKQAPSDVRLLRTLARLRATCPLAAVRDGVEAIRIAARIVRTGEEDPLLLDTLACAYAEAGNFPAAVTTAERALRAASRTEATDLAEEIEARLELFRAGKPYRQATP